MMKYSLNMAVFCDYYCHNLCKHTSENLLIFKKARYCWIYHFKSLKMVLSASSYHSKISTSLHLQVRKIKNYSDIFETINSFKWFIWNYLCSQNFTENLFIWLARSNMIKKQFLFVGEHKEKFCFVVSVCWWT
jgi:hypothetical protein